MNDEVSKLVRELELRLESKANALKIAIQQRDDALTEVRNLRALLNERDRLPPMLGGWFGAVATTDSSAHPGREKP